jgi:AraC-like DNA-binding protein
MFRRQISGPEIEHDLVRQPHLGYEAEQGTGFIRCVEQGSPTPLERWHLHDEYELHLIVSTQGYVFVGDYAGLFEPGHLVLTGPRLPHNWISKDLPPGGVALKSVAIQFSEKPLLEGMRAIPEFIELRGLLEKARSGIEFFGLGDEMRHRFYRIKGSIGLARFAEFIGLLDLLNRCKDYRVLSTIDPRGYDAQCAGVTVKKIVAYVNAHYAEPISVTEVSSSVGMCESAFSRFFKKKTGCTFTDYVNKLRVQKACELMMTSDCYVSTACFEVGFNNISNFNRRFLKIKGVTPSEFRRRAVMGSALPLP